MNSKKLVCRGITKKYGKKEVLQKVDLELEPGKIYGLIGRNGAGKTTLLSIMSAQNPTTQGGGALRRCTGVGEPGGTETYLFFQGDQSQFYRIFRAEGKGTLKDRSRLSS